MTIPNYQDFMEPVLKCFLNFENGARIIELYDDVANILKISEEEKNQLLQSGRQTIFNNRLNWAITYMNKAGLLERIDRGFYKITKTGIDALNSGKKINNKLLTNYKPFLDFFNRDSSSKNQHSSSLNLFDVSKKHIRDKIILEEDPETRLSKSISDITKNLEDDVLDILKSIHPKKFEYIVVDLMEAMSYGIGRVTPYSNDGGVDGIISEDELGLDKIYLQAKRYNDLKINEKEMRDFIGALETNTVDKGVFITTSFFSDKAKSLSQSSKHHIIRLIDGLELAKLMIKYNVGVKLKKGYEVKEIDNSFFENS